MANKIYEIPASMSFIYYSGIRTMVTKLNKIFSAKIYVVHKVKQVNRKWLAWQGGRGEESELTYIGCSEQAEWQSLCMIFHLLPLLACTMVLCQFLLEAAVFPWLQ